MQTPVKTICPDMNFTHNKHKPISFHRAVLYTTTFYLWLQESNSKCKQTNIKPHKRRPKIEIKFTFNNSNNLKSSRIMSQLPEKWGVWLGFFLFGVFGEGFFGSMVWGFLFYSFDSFTWKWVLKNSCFQAFLWKHENWKFVFCIWKLQIFIYNTVILKAENWEGKKSNQNENCQHWIKLHMTKYFYHADQDLWILKPLLSSGAATLDPQKWIGSKPSEKKNK